MRRAVLGVALLAYVRAAAVPPHDLMDPTPLSSDEQYLLPYLNELLQFRDTPMALEFIKITEFKDLVVPLIPPHGTITLPVNITLSPTLPFFNMGFNIPMPVALKIENMTISDLSWDPHMPQPTLKPAVLLPGTKFTWRSQLALEKISFTVQAKMTVMGHDFDVTIVISMSQLSIDATFVLAFDRKRICEVFGHTMASSVSCALQTLFMKERDVDGNAVSGLNFTALTLNVADFDTHISVSGFGPLQQMAKKRGFKVASRIFSTSQEMERHSRSARSGVAVDQGVGCRCRGKFGPDTSQDIPMLSCNSDTEHT